MIIDFHTHIFPPHARDNREDYMRRDATFGGMYADPKAEIASGEDLLEGMDAAGVDISIALGFAWQEHEGIVWHNDDLLDVAADSGGRIIPFTTINMNDPRAEREIRRCARAGARGLGELRPANQGWDLGGKAGDRLADIAGELGLVLLFHVTEPGDRDYPGRLGCDLADFTAYVMRHPGLTIVGAHLGGGVFAHASDAPEVYVDTAAQPFLYRDDAAGPAMRAVPRGHLLFGSDFPLITQRRQIDEIGRVFSNDECDAILGGNGAELLGLDA